MSQQSQRRTDGEISVFSPQLQAVISEILPSEDPLDDPNFNSVEYINSMFPNEQSLVDLDGAIGKLKGRISKTDDEILKSVRDQVSSGAKGKQSLEESKKSIRDLFNKINDIKAKAEQSERMVTEICRDIKSLDYAKRNLTATITALKRLHMLVTAVDQLKAMAAKKQYREAGQLLEAVNQLALHFADYKHIPKINEMTKDVNQIMEDLKSQIYKDFTAFWDSPGSVSPDLLSDACIVIDSLGKDTKREFMSWFVNKLLGEYNRFFRKGEESSDIENLERRFNWLKRTFVIYDEQYTKIFPEKWRMLEMLCEEFCFNTRQSLIDTLEETRHTIRIETLLGAIRKTIAFEKELGERFGSQTTEVQTHSPSTEEMDEPEEEITLDADPELQNPYSAKAIRARYRKNQRENAKKQQTEQQNKSKQKQVPKFQGILSSSFDLYMDLYIKNEDEKLKTALDKVVGEETWMVEDSEKTKVLSSSTDLVYYFKSVMTSTLTLTNNQAFYDLYLLFKKYLNAYAQIISDKIPSNAEQRLSEQQEKMICLIVNTAEYCGQTTIPGMSDLIKKKINPRFAEKIDLKPEQERFVEVVGKALQRLIDGFESKLGLALAQMAKMPWGSWESVEDQSEYVNQMSTYIHQSAPLYVAWFNNSQNFQFFYTSLVTSFVPKLIQNIYKCRRISDVGAQQLIVDFTAIRAILAELPSVGTASPNPAPAKYLQRLNKAMDKGDWILKVLLAPQSSLVDTYKSLIQDGSESDFQKLLDLKGITRSEQKLLLDAYSEKTTAERQMPGANMANMANMRRLLTTIPNFNVNMNINMSAMTDVFQRRGDQTNTNPQ